MSKWDGCPIIACKNDLCHDGCQVLKNRIVTEFDILCPVPPAGRRNADDMGLPSPTQQNRTDNG
jgi:hypothetical protein